jgi:uncharacterized protein YggE
MDDTRHITVVGQGSASAIPDCCALSLALNVAAETSAAALNDVAVLAARVIEVVHGHGLEAQTSDVSVHDFHDKESNRVTARVASYGLFVTVAALADAGPLVQQLAAVAGDALQIRGLQLGLSDASPLLETARRAAVVDALNRARQLGDAAGLTLGDIVSVDEGPPVGTDARFRRLAGTSVAMAATLPVEGGTSSVSVSVSVRVAIVE